MKQFLMLICLAVLVACSQSQEDNKFGEAIVYLKSKDGNFDLYKSDVLGKWEERITDNEGWDWQPHWIPSLKQLAYYTNDTSRNFSWVKKSMGSNEVDTLPQSDLLNLKLAPDAEWIYYMFEDGNATNIKRVRLNGEEDEYLTFSSHYNGRFSVDAQQKQMAFISDRNGSNQLFLMDLASKEIRQLTAAPKIAKYNSFSPDGTQIAVCLAEPYDDPKWDIYIIDIASNQQIRLTNTPYSEQEIAWSLSGEKIAFHGTTENDGDQIYTIDIADGKFTKITSGDFYHGEPAWIPN